MFDMSWGHEAKETVDYSAFNQPWITQTNYTWKGFVAPPPGFTEEDKNSDEGNQLFVSSLSISLIFLHCWWRRIRNSILASKWGTLIKPSRVVSLLRNLELLRVSILVMVNLNWIYGSKWISHIYLRLVAVIVLVLVVLWYLF